MKDIIDSLNTLDELSYEQINEIRTLILEN